MICQDLPDTVRTGKKLLKKDEPICYYLKEWMLRR